MAEPSIFAPGGDGMTRGGLDRYLDPNNGVNSNLPPAIQDSAQAADADRPLDCGGADRDEPVCQIARAERDRTSDAR